MEVGRKDVTSVLNGSLSEECVGRMLRTVRRIMNATGDINRVKGEVRMCVCGCYVYVYTVYVCGCSYMYVCVCARERNCKLFIDF